LVNNGVAQYFGYLPKENATFVLDPTIRFGCALTSAATMLATFPSLSNMTPEILDGQLVSYSNLSASSGYLMGKNAGHPDFSIMNWSALNRLSPSIDYKAYGVAANGTIASESQDQYLTDHVCSDGDRVIIKLNETIKGTTGAREHFVYVTGQAPSSGSGNIDWSVLDPGWANVQPPANLLTLSGHTDSMNGGFSTRPGGPKHTFTVAGVITNHDLSATGQTNATSATTQANSPVELLITDPQGRTLGSSDGADDGADVYGIPGASYFRDYPIADDTDDTGTAPASGDPTGVKTAHIPAALDGTYQIQATGTAAGTFTLIESFVASDGSWQTSSFTGITNVGSVATYQMLYSSSPGTVPQLTLMASSPGTLPSSQVSATATGLAYSRVSQTFNGTVTIKNIGDSTVTGPFQMVCTSLTAGVTLANATNTFAGIPYISVPAATSLSPGQSATVSVQFKNPANAVINFTPVIYSGSL
jgi:hypothetical protein